MKSQKSQIWWFILLNFPLPFSIISMPFRKSARFFLNCGSLGDVGEKRIFLLLFSWLLKNPISGSLCSAIHATTIPKGRENWEVLPGLGFLTLWHSTNARTPEKVPQTTKCWRRKLRIFSSISRRPQSEEEFCLPTSLDQHSERVDLIKFIEYLSHCHQIN